MTHVGVRNFIGDRLIQAKNARGMTSLGLSKLSGISQSSICLYQKGKQNPRTEIVEKFAKTLNVPQGFFFKEMPRDKPKNVFYCQCQQGLRRHPKARMK